MVGNIGRSGGKAPSKESVEMLALLVEAVDLLRDKSRMAEAKAVTRESVTERAALAAEREAASERIAEADRKMAALAAAEAAHAKQLKSDAETLDARQTAVSSREGQCERREAGHIETDRSLSLRETAVSDAERRIARTREQLGAVA